MNFRHDEYVILYDALLSSRSQTAWMCLWVDGWIQWHITSGCVVGWQQQFVSITCVV